LASGRGGGGRAKLDPVPKPCGEGTRQKGRVEEKPWIGEWEKRGFGLELCNMFIICKPRTDHENQIYLTHLFLLLIFVPTSCSFTTQNIFYVILSDYLPFCLSVFLSLSHCLYGLKPGETNSNFTADQFEFIKQIPIYHIRLGLPRAGIFKIPPGWGT
jgi:hypothetical protein